MKHLHKQTKLFLQDPQFLELMLFKTEKQQLYWADYIRKHPEEEAAFKLAQEEFAKLKLKSDSFPKERQAHLYDQIISDINSYKNRFKRRRIFRYAAAVAVFAVVSMTTYFYMHQQLDEPFLARATEEIIGMELPEERVYLLSSKEIIRLEDNSNLNVSEEGEILLQNESDKKSLKKGETSSTLVVPYGKRSFIKLSDGTSVWVNSGSRISFPTVFEGATREISMEGEIFLDVEKMPAKPFIVRTGNMKIQVYGTSFNISAYADEAESSVVLVEGSVKISTSHGEVMLEPNKRVILSENGVNVLDANVDEYISWKNGYLVLKKASLNDVLKQIERYYNIAFSSKSKLNAYDERLSGKLYLSNNIDSIMSSLSTIYPFKYERKDNMISISK